MASPILVPPSSGKRMLIFFWRTSFPSLNSFNSAYSTSPRRHNHSSPKPCPHKNWGYPKAYESLPEKEGDIPGEPRNGQRSSDHCLNNQTPKQANINKIKTKQKNLLWALKLLEPTNIFCSCKQIWVDLIHGTQRILNNTQK